MLSEFLGFGPRNMSPAAAAQNKAAAAKAAEAAAKHKAEMDRIDQEWTAERQHLIALQEQLKTIAQA